MSRIHVSIAEFLDSLAPARAAAEKYELLSNLSDTQLAARGLDRSSIFHQLDT